jgi:hypothetical protein
VSRTSIALVSTLSDDATDWITANWPIPDAKAASRSTATRVRLGMISLSVSSHLALKLYSS